MVNHKIIIINAKDTKDSNSYQIEVVVNMTQWFEKSIVKLTHGFSNWQNK